MSQPLGYSKPGKPSPHRRRLERIREAFSQEDLIRVLEMDSSEFTRYAHRVDLPDSTKQFRGSSERFFYYRDTGAPVLAVAHLDHVQWDPTAQIVETSAGPVVFSGALDDRLGAYVILELLPKLGIKVDWLLTTDEEMGASTASEFMVEHKQYNWMIEFDRGGTDVVMYQYEDSETRRLVKAAGAHVGLGSYSDIADLEHLGCAGFNWGVGYEDYHSKRSHAFLEDTFDMVAKFMRFYAQNAATHLEYEAHDWRSDLDWCEKCQTSLDMFGRCWGCEEPQADAVAEGK